MCTTVNWPTAAVLLATLLVHALLDPLVERSEAPLPPPPSSPQAGA